MRKDRRLFGNNLRLFLLKKGITVEEFAKGIGCTEYELCQIMDARLILNAEEEETIANALQLPVDEMYVERDSEEYELAGCMECRGRFSDQNHKKLVLDLLDIYCDVQEIMADEVM